MSDDKPVVAGKTPQVKQLEPGTYFWCACGRSKNQPLCDGAHQGTSFAPVQFELTEQKQVALCMCKQTQTPPFCDGTHNKL